MSTSPKVAGSKDRTTSQLPESMMSVEPGPWNRAGTFSGRISLAGRQYRASRAAMYFSSSSVEPYVWVCEEERGIWFGRDEYTYDQTQRILGLVT